LTEICLKCAHSISLHKIEIIGNYDFVQVVCSAQTEDYSDSCNCDAGFKKVVIKKEFNQMG